MIHAFDLTRMHRWGGLAGPALVMLVAILLPFCVPSSYVWLLMVLLLLAAALAALPLLMPDRETETFQEMPSLAATPVIPAISNKSITREIAVKPDAKLMEELESLRHIQHDLLAAKQAAEAAMMAKGEFLATMSHEIRTPLNGVLPLLELVLASKLDVDQRDCLETANKSAHELLRIVDDILDYSKLEASKVELETVGVNLKDIVDAVTHLMERNANNKGLKLLVMIEPGVRLAVRGDPIRLRQILTNLVSNAIKFTERGSVTVQISKRNETRTHYETLFAVKDTGVGLSTEAANKLFQPFSQADASTTRVFGGTGLGLVICKRLVDLMGGRIGVRSEIGKGSLFWFSVPLLKAIGDMQVRRDLGGIRAVLLASEPVFSRRLSGCFSSFGINFLQTATFMDALTKLRTSANLGDSWAYELLVVDLSTFRSAIPSLTRNVLRESVLERLRILLLTDKEEEIPSEFASHTRVRHLSRQSSESVLRMTLNELLDVAGAEPPRVSLLANSADAWQQLQIDEQVPKVAAISLQGHILLVEDNVVNRLVAQRLLGMFGLSCDLAENGREALERLNQENYDLVLMDCQMPVMDGYTATRARRMQEKERGLPRLPIVAMTANAMAGDREKCLAAGMDDYLSKPLNQPLMEQTLRRWLPENMKSRPRPLGNAAQADAITGPRKLATSGLTNSAAIMGTSPAAKPTLSPSLEPASALDTEVVRDLLDVMGDEFNDLIRVYLEDAPKNLAVLIQAAASKDSAALVAAAHSLKSTSANLGALAFSESATRIEHGVRSGTLDNLEDLVSQLSNEYLSVAEALRLLLSRADASAI